MAYGGCLVTLLWRVARVVLIVYVVSLIVAARLWGAM